MPATPQQLIQYLQSKGMSPVAAMGLVARWQQESGQQLNPTALGDRTIPGGSQGIGQWNRDRLANLRAFGGNAWTDPYKQADFALGELGIAGDPSMPGYGSEAMAGKLFRTAATPEQAVGAGMAYERPQGYVAGHPELGHGYGNTLRNYGALSSGTPQVRPDAKSPQEAMDMASPGNPAMQPQAPVAPIQGPQLPAQQPNPEPGKKGWRDRLSKAISGFKMPEMAKGDATVPQQPMAAPVQQGMDAPSIDPAFNEQTRNQLAMAMQRLNTGRLWG